MLDDLGVSTLNFHLTDAQKQGLIRKGEECTCAYLTEWQRWQRDSSRPSQMLPADTEVTIEGSGRCGSAFPPSPAAR